MFETTKQADRFPMVSLWQIRSYRPLVKKGSFRPFVADFRVFRHICFNMYFNMSSGNFFALVSNQRTSHLHNTSQCHVKQNDDLWPVDVPAVKPLVLKIL
jgi:hypothetical protein